MSSCDHTMNNAETNTGLRSDVLQAQVSNAALMRLQSRALASAEASEVITSYDRMHHRHSRS